MSKEKDGSLAKPGNNKNNDETKGRFLVKSGHPKTTKEYLKLFVSLIANFLPF